jgi:hypothetical protein
LKSRKGHFLFEISFPPSNILFFHGQYFSAGVGKQKMSPGKSFFHDTMEKGSFFQPENPLFLTLTLRFHTLVNSGIKRVRVRKVDFPGWKKVSLLFQALYRRK